MTPVAATKALIVSFPAFNALAGERAYALKLPQDPVLPAARLQQVSEIVQRHLRGRSSVRVARIQVDVYAQEGSGNPYQTAHSVMDAIYGEFDAGVVTGLAGFSGDVGSPPFHIDEIAASSFTETYDPLERRQVIVSRDFFMVFRAG